MTRAPGARVRGELKTELGLHSGDRSGDALYVDGERRARDGGRLGDLDVAEHPAGPVVVGAVANGVVVVSRSIDCARST